jgi:thiamine-monophosphate kinase
VTGSIGNAALGLEMLQERPPWLPILKSHERDFLETAYKYPALRLKESILIKEYAHAAIDVSDGLLADLQHICIASSLQAHLRLEKIPFSEPALKVIEWFQENRGEDIRSSLVTSGDDYELLFTLSPDVTEEVEHLFKKSHFALGHIGYVADPIYNKDIGKINVLDEEGKALSFDSLGYQHFKENRKRA